MLTRTDFIQKPTWKSGISATSKLLRHYHLLEHTRLVGKPVKKECKDRPHLTVLEHDSINRDRLTLRRPPPIVEVVEIATETLIPRCAAAESEGAVAAD